MLSGLGAAVARAGRRSSPTRTGRPGPPGLRPHRGGAGGDQHAVQRRAPRAARSAPRCPGIDLRLRRRGRPQRPRGRTPARSRSRGANLFSGYWPDGADGPDDDGWWATGDVGFLDATGDLFLVDRLKELVIVSGFNVYPVEVEDVIREVAGRRRGRGDRGRGRGDRRGGGRLRARAREPTPAAIADAVRAHCAQRLARFKQPARIEVVDELPLTVTGKVQKGRLRGLERRRARSCWSERDRTARPRVTLYSRPGLPPVRRRPRGGRRAVCADLGEAYAEVSIDDDPALRERFGEEIPVTFVDGRQHDFWRVDETRLRTALADRDTVSDPGRRGPSHMC